MPCTTEVRISSHCSSPRHYVMFRYVGFEIWKLCSIVIPQQKQTAKNVLTMTNIASPRAFSSHHFEIIALSLETWRNEVYVM